MAKKNRHLTTIIVSVISGGILALLGAGTSYSFFRPPAIPFALCEPLRGVAALDVQCESQSQYHKSLVWDFGDKESPGRLGDDRITHSYRQPGRYTITLTAYGKGSPNSWSTSILVLEPTAVSRPLTAAVTATTKESRVVRRKVAQVGRTKDDHPVMFSSHSREYSETFRADPGFRIAAATFRERSASRADGITQRVSPDGTEITIAYRLTSGPSVDRYRGWLNGDLVIDQEQIEPAQTLTLASALEINHYGSYSLPENTTLDSLESASILGNDGQVVAHGAPGSLLIAEEYGMAFLLEEDQGQLFLRVEPTTG